MSLSTSKFRDPFDRMATRHVRRAGRFRPVSSRNQSDKRRAIDALTTGGRRFAVPDRRRQNRRSPWRVWLVIRAAAPFGVDPDRSDRQPGPVPPARARTGTRFSTFHGGFVHLAAATRP